MRIVQRYLHARDAITTLNYASDYDVKHLDICLSMPTFTALLLLVISYNIHELPNQ